MAIGKAGIRSVNAESPFNISADLIVYGATPGGLSAAICAKRAGVRSVAIVGGWREYVIGGMMSGGLAQTDIGNQAAVTGFTKEFFWRLSAIEKYGSTNVVFQPKNAPVLFQSYLTQLGIPVYLGVGGIDGCDKSGVRITGFHTIGGYSVTGKVFVDATYEGDLIAFAGISYIVGRESNAQYGETHNGVQYGNSTSHQLYGVSTDPYAQPGIPSSGLISGVSLPTSVNGAADGQTQAYGFRITLTNLASNRRSFPGSPPPGYNPATYEGLGRYLAALTAAGQNPGPIQIFITSNSLPNNKLDANNQGPFSTDFVPRMNTAYPDAGFSYKTNRRINYGLREQIWQAHINYTLGLFFWLRNSADPRIPASILSWANTWWTCLDENVSPGFGDPPGWPSYLYIRAARRMISERVWTEIDSTRPNTTPSSDSDIVAIGSYSADSHITDRYLQTNGYVQTEGGIFVSTGGAVQTQQFPFSILRPRQSECDNLMTTWSASSSHVGFCGFRLEPISMAAGQAVGNAARLALPDSAPQVPVQQISIPALQTAIVAQGASISLPQP